MWKTVKHFMKYLDSLTIQTITITEDRTIKWNDINSHKKLKITTVDDIELMNKYFAEKNIQHLNQVQYSPLTIEPLKSLLRSNSFTTFLEQLLAGTPNLNSLNITPLIRAYLQNFKDIINITKIKINKYSRLSTRILKVERMNYMISIILSLLWHHYAWLVLHGTVDDNITKNSAETMRNVYYQITTIYMINENALLRWILYIVILLPKDRGRPKRSLYWNHKLLWIRIQLNPEIVLAIISNVHFWKNIMG